VGQACDGQFGADGRLGVGRVGSAELQGDHAARAETDAGTVFARTGDPAARQPEVGAVAGADLVGGDRGGDLGVVGGDGVEVAAGACAQCGQCGLGGVAV